MKKSCENKPTDLAPEEALAIIEPYFFAIRDKFAIAGLSLVKRTALSCSHKMHDTARHFAGCSTDGRQIVVAPEMAELPEEFVIGILAHELGHATDFLYPGEFVIGVSDKIGRRLQRETTDKQWLRWQREWDKRDPYVVERTADLIAEHVWGTPIGYAGPCLIQTFERGIPRPEDLR